MSHIIKTKWEINDALAALFRSLDEHGVDWLATKKRES